MPLFNCDNCGHEQMVRREMAGLLVECERCKEEFRAVEREPKEPEVFTGPSEGIPLGKTALLLGGLVVVVGLIFGVAVLIINSGKPDTKPTSSKLKEPPRPKQELVLTEKESDEAKAKTAKTVGGLIVVGIAVLVILYGLLILVTGAWIARDAATRGMNSLGWPWFYYYFHVFGRIASCLLTIPAVAIVEVIGPEFSPVVVALGELGAWFALAVYFAARRHGRCVPCRRCKRTRLEYLVTCPICGASDERQR